MKGARFVLAVPADPAFQQLRTSKVDGSPTTVSSNPDLFLGAKVRLENVRIANGAGVGCSDHLPVVVTVLGIRTRMDKGTPVLCGIRTTVARRTPEDSGCCVPHFSAQGSEGISRRVDGTGANTGDALFRDRHQGAVYGALQIETTALQAVVDRSSREAGEVPSWGESQGAQIRHDRRQGKGESTTT